MIYKDLPLDKSILIIGPPETGKSSLLKSLPAYQNALYVDLEDPLLAMELLKRRELMEEILAEVDTGQWLTITRLDRIAKYLPLITETLRNKKIFLAATASSVKNLDGIHNLSRFFHLHFCSALGFSQIQNTTSLKDILSFGTLPKVYNFEKEIDKIRYLKNYVQEFLDLEIILRSQIRNLVPFHLFLPLAADFVGQKINYSSLAQDLNTDYKTVQNYFDLLIDNQVGFYLESYPKEIRKAQIRAPQFYLFDPGFHRALSNKIDTPLNEHSSEYNQLFKAWCIAEIKKSNDIQNRGFKLSQLKTKHGIGIDLVIERPDGSTDLVIFVNTPQILPKHLKSLLHLGQSIPEANLICVTSVAAKEKHAHVEIVSYINFLNRNA